MKELNIAFKKDWKLLAQQIDEILARISNQDFSENLLLYLVVAEDHRFQHHYGVDPIALLRAFWQSKFKKSRQGGSTVAMQLVRTVTGSREITLKRKFSEIILSMMVTNHYSKKDILKAYLSSAYFGWNMHGLEQVCVELGYNKSSIDHYEAAAIIARLKYPEPKFFDLLKSKRIQKRALHILHRYNQFNLEGKSWNHLEFQKKSKD